MTIQENFRYFLLNSRNFIHALYIFSEYIKFNIDRTPDSESSDIGYTPGMWYKWYCQIVISGSYYSETHTIQCNASLLDDESTVLGIKVHAYEIWIIIIASYLSNSANSIYMPWDEVSIDTSLGSDTPFYVEYISDFFRSKIGTRKTLFHCEKCIILRCDIGQCHANTIMSNTLSYCEWFIMEIIFHCEVATITSNKARCAFDNSGEQER